LSACATQEQVVAKIDDRTAVTFTTASQLEFTHRAYGVGMNPQVDLSLGPVEIDKAGERTYAIWVAVMSFVPTPAPRIKILGKDGTELLLEPSKLRSVAALPLSKWAYDAPVRWAKQYYYAVTLQDLERFRGQAPVSVVMLVVKNNWITFEDWKRQPAGFDAFLDHVN
jgi:hypothetical protein